MSPGGRFRIEICPSLEYDFVEEMFSERSTVSYENTSPEYGFVPNVVPGIQFRTKHVAGVRFRTKPRSPIEDSAPSKSLAYDFVPKCVAGVRFRAKTRYRSTVLPQHVPGERFRPKSGSPKDGCAYKSTPLEYDFVQKHVKGVLFRTKTSSCSTISFHSASVRSFDQRRSLMEQLVFTTRRLSNRICKHVVAFLATWLLSFLHAVVPLARTVLLWFSAMDLLAHMTL